MAFSGSERTSMAIFISTPRVQPARSAAKASGSERRVDFFMDGLPFGFASILSDGSRSAQKRIERRKRPSTGLPFSSRAALSRLGVPASRAIAPQAEEAGEIPRLLLRLPSSPTTREIPTTLPPHSRSCAGVKDIVASSATSGGVLARRVASGGGAVFASAGARAGASRGRRGRWVGAGRAVAFAVGTGVGTGAGAGVATGAGAGRGVGARVRSQPPAKT